MLGVSKPAAAGVRATAVQGLMFCAVPDKGLVPIQPKNGKMPTAVFQNCIVLPPQVHQQLVRHAHVYWHPMQDPFPLKGFTWIVNICADPDEYATALDALEAATKGSKIAIFNRPEAVRLTARDTITKALAGIEGLIVPKCIRFAPKLPKDFQEAFEQGGFDYPVLIRPAAAQTGRGLIKIDGETDWDKIFTIDWAGRSLFMTQFVERRDDEGRFTKFRVAYVNRTAFLRSAYTRDEPIIHGVPRTPDSIRQEIATIERLGKNTRLQKIIAEIGRRVPLNFFGVDLGYSADGDFVFFESNAAMSITSMANTPDAHRELFAPILTPIYQALARAISTPSSWDCWPQATVSKGNATKA